MNTPSESLPKSPIAALDELVRLNKIVTDCEHSLLIARRIHTRGRGHFAPIAEVAAVTEKMEKAKRERDWLEGAINRFTKHGP